MARKRNFIGITDTSKLSALGNQKQRDFGYIAGLINDPNILSYFAEPSIRADNQKIDWYSEAEGKGINFNEFNAADVNRVKTELTHLMQALEEKRKLSETDFDKETIRNLTMLPDEDSIKKVGNKFVIINWAYKLHKKEKSNKNPENFAGLAEDPNFEDSPKNNYENKQGSLEKPQQEELQTNADAFQKPNDNKAELDNSNAESISNEEAVEEKKDPLKSTSNFLKQSWLWVAVFLFLLLLNVLMLKDACGIKSFPFLYFC